MFSIDCLHVLSTTPPINVIILLYTFQNSAEPVLKKSKMEDSILSLKPTQTLPVPSKSKLPKVHSKSEKIISKTSPHKTLMQNGRKEVSIHKSSAEKFQPSKGLCSTKTTSGKPTTNVKAFKTTRKPGPTKTPSQKVSNTTQSSKKPNPSRVGISSKTNASKNAPRNTVSEKKKASTVKSCSSSPDVQPNLTDWKGMHIYSTVYT